MTDLSSKEALELLQNTAVDASVKRLPQSLGEVAAALPANYTIVDLEEFRDAPRAFKGSFITASLDDYVAYVDQQEAGTVFCETEGAVRGKNHGRRGLSARAIFDIGSVGEPGWGRHQAVLTYTPTPEFNAFLEAIDARLTQQDFIYWLQDLQGLIFGYRSAAALDDESPLLELDFTQTVNSIRSVQVTARTDRNHVVQDFKQSSTSLDEVEARMAGLPPEGVIFKGIAYEGLPAITALARMSIIALDDEKPRFSLRLVMPGALERSIGEHFKNALRANLRLPVIVGSFSRG